MCFTKSTQNTHKKSDVDVDCYKLMYLGFYTGKLKSVFYPEEAYSAGDNMIPSVKISDEIIDMSSEVNGGVIHSYKSLVIARDARRGYMTMFQMGNITIVRCTIPAGTSYWYNNKGECISKELVIKEILER